MTQPGRCSARDTQARRGPSLAHRLAENDAMLLEAHHFSPLLQKKVAPPRLRWNG